MKNIVFKCVLGVATIVALVGITTSYGKHLQDSFQDSPVFILSCFNEHGSITDTVFTHRVDFKAHGTVGCVDMDSGKYVETSFKNAQIEDVTEEYHAQHRCLKCFKED